MIDERQSDYTEPQAARILGVSARTLQRWRRAGAIGCHVWPGGRVSYSHDQLAAFRARCRVEPVS